MIRYTLKCANDHQFESWFQSSDAYTALRDGGHVSCAICGSDEVQRAPMAPRLGKAATDAPRLSEPGTEVEAAMTALRKQVEENSDYVGLSFAKEARAMHEGSAPERAIYGEAKPDEAKALIEDGIPVAPLPFMPKRKAN